MRNLILLVSIMLTTITAFSEVILVPSQNMSWTAYRDHCLLKNYKCLPDAFTELIDSKNIFYQNLISDFDLEDSLYIQSFHKNFLRVLKNEMLDIEQLEYLLLAAEKVLFKKSNQNLKKDYIYFSEILLILQKADVEVLPEKSLILFRKPINFNLLTKKQLSRLSEIKYYKISFNQNLITNKYFLTGDCLNYSYNFNFTTESQKKFLPIFKDSCSMTEGFSQSTADIKKHLEKHKVTYFWSTLALSAALFLKSYNVSLK